METTIYDLNSGMSKKGKLWFYIIIALATEIANDGVLEITVMKDSKGQDTQFCTVWLTKDAFDLCKKGDKVRIIRK